MPIFERPPLDTLAPAKDRWTPVYLQHGRIEVDDASIKWIGGDGTTCPIPVATLSALILGPGTTVTHAAIKAAERQFVFSPPAWGWTFDQGVLRGLSLYLVLYGFVNGPCGSFFKRGKRI